MIESSNLERRADSLTAVPPKVPLEKKKARRVSTRDLPGFGVKRKEFDVQGIPVDRNGKPIGGFRYGEKE